MKYSPCAFAEDSHFYHPPKNPWGEAGRFHSPKLRSPERFYHQCLGWFLILINPKLRKKGAIAVWKRVLKKSFFNLPPTLKTPCFSTRQVD
ncbi:hypothetical protein ACE09Y_08230 [Raphidiopsis sp. BLCC-F218]